MRKVVVFFFSWNATGRRMFQKLWAKAFEVEKPLGFSPKPGEPVKYENMNMNTLSHKKREVHT